MHDKLFDNQRHLKEKALRRYAEELGISLERYDSEMADHLYLQRVQEHIASGRSSGVHHALMTIDWKGGLRPAR